MSEVKFACPSCGQNIIAESCDSGRQTVCPNCQKALTIPLLSAAVPPDPAATPTSASATVPPVHPSAPPAHAKGPVLQRTSGLAIASLICALLVCAGSIPAIICGHLAKRRIRRDPSLTGIGLANAGLIIGYLSLLACGGRLAYWTYNVVTGAKQAFREVETMVQQQTTNATSASTSNGEQEIVTTTAGTQDTMPAPSDQTIEPAPSTTSRTQTTTAPPSSQAQSPSASAWTLDLSHVSVPNQPASGSFRGTNFVGQTFRYKNGLLTISSADGFAFLIKLGLKKGDPVGETSWRVLPSDTAPSCKVSLRWKQDGKTTQHGFGNGYALTLQFGKPAHNRIPGKIYLCLPDGQKSYVAGTFKSGR